MRTGAAFAVLGALLLGPDLLKAQSRPVSPFAHEHPRTELSVALHPALASLGNPDAPTRVRFERFGGQDQPIAAPWWTPLASAVIPGSGQLVMRQRRGVPYLAAEAFLLLQYFEVRSNAREFRSEYQRLAQVARSFFTDQFPAGDFEYYERMEQFVESGAYDLGVNGAFQPEVDTLTFNGFTWRLARRTYWEDPDVMPELDSEAYRRAVDFYEERAVRDEFRWSWQNAQLEQDLFRQTIERSNGAFRRTSQYLGVLIANHALSAIDAFVMLRLSRASGPTGEYRIEGRVPWAPFGRGGLAQGAVPPRE
ncbi:MAG TPA: hypothetical protein VMM77_03655 [Gemmatimonadaceae bacterium]|nr:hypothetical protein [Gemmatimonadaceae bacterium]